MRGRTVAVLLLLLVGLSPAALAKGCSEAAPCVLAVTSTDATLVVDPSRVEGLGPYVLRLANQGGETTMVSLGDVNVTATPGNVSQSAIFRLPQVGSYTLSAAPSGASATLEVVEAADGPRQDKSTELLAFVLPMLVGVALIGLAILVLRNGRVHVHNRFFAAYFLLSGLKSFSEGIYSKADVFHATSPLFPDAQAWAITAAFCALAMLPTLLLFLGHFPRPLPLLQRRPLLGAVVVLPSLVVAVLLVGLLRGQVALETFIVAQEAFNIYGTMLTVLALVLILRATKSTERIERQQARFVAGGFLPAFAIGWVITVLQLLPDYDLITQSASDRHVLDLIHFVSPVLELLSAGAVAFAILRFNILGISPKFRVGVKSFLVGLIFVVVFLATQFLENVVLQGQLFAFAGDYGSFILSGVSGIVLFKPIEVVSTKAADRLVPKTKADEAAARTAEVYRAQCIYVLRDAHVTEREIAFLRNLRDQLGLSEAQARGIEEEVERTLKVDAPQTGASATTAPAFIAAAAAEMSQPPEVHRASPLPPAAAAPEPVTALAAAPARKAAKPAKPLQAKPKSAAKGSAKTAAKPAGKPSAKAGKAPPKAAKKR